MKPIEPKERLIVALDVPSLEEAKPLVDQLLPYVGMFKLGLEMFYSVGAPQAIRFVRTLGGKVFADAKLDDIPNTDAGAARGIIRSGVEMFNLHIGAGRQAILETVKAIEEIFEAERVRSPLLFGVTLLTSLGENDLAELGYGLCCDLDQGGLTHIEEIVVKRAILARQGGLDGVIASPREAVVIRRYCPDLLIVTPGIRPSGSSSDDQKRVATPASAIWAGADYLVVGRPITRPASGAPAEAAKRILDEIAAAG